MASVTEQIKHRGHLVSGKFWPLGPTHSSTLDLTLRYIWYSLVLESWKVCSSPFLSLHLGSLWFRVVVPFRVLSIGQIDLFKDYSYPTGSCANRYPVVISYADECLLMSSNTWMLHCWPRPSSSTSSSRRAISTDIPDALSPPLFIVHCFQQVFRVTSCIGTELLYVGSSLSPGLYSSMWRCPQEYIPCELVLTFPTSVPHVWFV